MINFHKVYRYYLKPFDCIWVFWSLVVNTTRSCYSMIRVCKLSDELCMTHRHGFSKQLYIPGSQKFFPFSHRIVHSNLLRMLDLCVEIPMDFRTAIHYMTRVRYRLRDSVDTKTYWVTADLLFYCIPRIKWIIPWKFYNNFRLSDL